MMSLQKVLVIFGLALAVAGYAGHLEGAMLLGGIIEIGAVALR